MSYVGQFEKVRFFEPAIQTAIRAAKGLAPEERQKRLIDEAAEWMPVARATAPTVGKFVLVGVGFFIAWWFIGCE